MSNEMRTYTVHTSYREYDERLGGLRLYHLTKKFDAVSKESAKDTAWHYILSQNPNRTLDRQIARASHRE